MSGSQERAAFMRPLGLLFCAALVGLVTWLWSDRTLAPVAEPAVGPSPDRVGAGRIDMESVIKPAETERIIRLVAAHMRGEVHDTAPIISAELPHTGERFEGILPPVSAAPCFATCGLATDWTCRRRPTLRHLHLGPFRRREEVMLV